MLAEAIARIERELPRDALLLDAGGWAAPLARADWVIDVMPHATRGLYGPPLTQPERFTEQTWVQQDMCGPWPFEDDQFDFAVCAHTLEDLRDPVVVCSELSRVARAGYVEVPAPVEELTWGVQGEWVGWGHHRWICEHENGGLRFVAKPHLLPAEGRHLPRGSTDRLSAEQLVLQVWWEGSIPGREHIFIGAGEFDPWLAGLLASAP